MEFIISVDIFNIFPQTRNLLLRQILKTKGINQVDFFANLFSKQIV